MDGTPTPQGAVSKDESLEIEVKDAPGDTATTEKEEVKDDSEVEKNRREFDSLISKKDAELKKVQIVSDKTLEIGKTPAKLETLLAEDSELADTVSQKIWGMTAEEVISSLKPETDLNEDELLEKKVSKMMLAREHKTRESSNRQATADTLLQFNQKNNIKEGSEEDLALGKVYKDIIEDIPLIKRTPQKIQSILELALVKTRGSGEQEGTEEEFASVSISNSQSTKRSKVRLSKEQLDWAKANDMKPEDYAKYSKSSQISIL